MTNINKKNDMSVRLSFMEMFQQTKNQIEFFAFTETEKDLASELCRIIVNTLRDTLNEIIYISGEKVLLADVQEIFSMLKHDHISLVIDKYKKIETPVRNPKKYLRAMLYNSYFELEAYFENLLNV